MRRKTVERLSKLPRGRWRLIFVFLRGRAGKETDKRNLTLVDDTCTEISLTLWGASAKGDERRWEGNPVVAFKGVKVS